MTKNNDFSATVDIVYNDTDYKADVLIHDYYESNWGCDADGNRGVPHNERDVEIVNFYDYNNFPIDITRATYNREEWKAIQELAEKACENIVDEHEPVEIDDDPDVV